MVVCNEVAYRLATRLPPFHIHFPTYSMHCAAHFIVNLPLYCHPVRGSERPGSLYVPYADLSDILEYVGLFSTTWVIDSVLIRVGDARRLRASEPQRMYT